MTREDYRLTESEDPTTRARARGRLITSNIAHLIRTNDRGGYWIDMRRVLAGEGAFSREDGLPVGIATWVEDPLRHLWNTHILPAGGFVE